MSGIETWKSVMKTLENHMELSLWKKEGTSFTNARGERL
jgi:hypothetical protein